MKSEGYDYIAAYRGEKSKLLSVVREMWFRLGLPCKELWFNSALNNYSYTIIINDAMMTTNYLKWVRDNNPDARLIFWYWNNITEKVIQPDVVKKMGYELWSFSKKDCDKYGLRYNAQFFSEPYYKKCNIKIESVEKYDICFVGKDKGRMAQIENLEKQTGLKIDKYFVADHFYEFYKNSKYHIKSLNYREMLQRYMRSKAILDIVTDVDGGISLRILDGAYLGRKVITNCKSVKQYEFYHPNNVFVLGVDNLETLEEFFSKPYLPIPDDIIAKYEFDAWIKRIEEDRPINGENECSLA